MSHQTFLADAPAVRDRGEWFLEVYPLNPSGVATTLRFSRRGTSTGKVAVTIGTESIPAHTVYRRRLLVSPTMTQSLWSPGKILSRSIPSFGSFKLSNADGGLDQYHPNQGWTWNDCRFKCYFADRTDIQSTIGKVSDGFMSDPDWTLKDVTVPTKGRESLFEAKIPNRVFRGTSYMLELFGDKTVSYGTPSPLNITGSLTSERWIWLEALPTVGAVTYGWFGGTASPWRVAILSTGVIRLFAHIGGVQETVTSTLALSTFKFYHLAVVISGRDVTFYLYDDDTQVLSTDTQVNAFSSSTRSVNTGGTFVDRSGSDATFKPWFDESRVWNVARSLTEIEANRFRPLTVVPASCVHRVGYDDGTGTTVTDSSASAAHGTISGAGTSAWLWAHEGGPELAGVSKPDVWGERWGVKPIIVDPVRQGYCVAGDKFIYNLATYEGGNPHILDLNAASFRAYIVATPIAGHCLPYLTRGLFKLGSSPTLPISAKVNGYSGGALGYVNTGANISRDMITRKGPKIPDPTEIDTGSFTTYNALPTSTGICGIAIYQPEPIKDVLDLLLASGAGWWGYLRSSILFHVERFNGPGSVANFNFDEKKIISITPLPPIATVFQVIVRFRKNDVKHTEDQVAAAIKSTADWTQWTLEWLEQVATDESLRSSSAVTLVVDTALQYQADARVLADYLLSVLKGKKVGWSTVVSAVGLEATIGQTTTLGVELQGNVTRYNLDNTDKFCLLSVSDQRQQGTVRLDHWGSA